MTNENHNNASEKADSSVQDVDSGGKKAIPIQEFRGEPTGDSTGLNETKSIAQAHVDDLVALKKKAEEHLTTISGCVHEVERERNSAKVRMGSLRNDVQGHHDKAFSVIERMKQAAQEFENELVKLKESTQEKSRMGDQYAEETEANRKSMNELVAGVTEHHDETIASIDEAKKVAESCANDLVALKKSGEESSEGAATARSSAEESAKVAAEQAHTVESNRDSAKRFVDDIEKNKNDAIVSLETIKKHEANAKLIADRAEEKDEKVNEYQEQLKKLTTACMDLKANIESLLPGATSASLASAFGARKKSFKWPKRFWTALFICSIGGFMIVGWYVFRQQNITSITEFFMYALKKTPILVAIILLAEFARRQYNITLRLEEDYGYKEVLSRSFEGYRKQMEEIAQSPDTPVSKLSGNLLEAMAQQPGRLIDKEKPLKPPSADFIEEIANKVQDFLKKKG